jgi:hypothetical protein
MTAVVIRIVLRWLAGFLVAKGYFAPEDGLWLQTDPDVAMLGQIALGFGVGLLSEAWYFIAKKLRWAT